MRLCIVGLVVLSPLLLYACGADGDPAQRSKTAVESIQTRLDDPSCKKEIDRSDPNETPYFVCPGVGGYGLIVRRVDSGRESIEVVDPGKRVSRLNYQEVITRHMNSLGEQVEWRVQIKDGRQVPIALIVRVHAREDKDNPAKVTQTYAAVAKITPSETCVTDRIAEGAQADAEVRSKADTARERQCAPPQPPMVVDGVVVR